MSIYNRTRGPTTTLTSTPKTGSLYSLTWNGETNYNDASRSSDYANASDQNTEYFVMSDVVTPNFKSRIAKGEVINNPATMTRNTETKPVPTSFARESVHKTSDGRFYGQSWFGTKAVDNSALQLPLYFDATVAAAIASLRDQAVTQAHANASSSELQSLVMAAEARKSVDSMASIMRRVFKIAKAAKRLDLRYLRKQIEFSELQDRYMELRYAIRPLVYDAKGTLAALDESRSYKRTRSTARGFKSYSNTISDTVTHMPDGSHRMTIGRTSTITVEIRAGVLCDVATSAVSIWGLDQPLETLWELVPFSFIVDWFCNVGDTIAAWTPNAGVRELASWVTTRKVTTHENTLISVENVGGDWNYRNRFSWSGKRTIVQEDYLREVNPQLSFYPRANIRLDTLKLADLAIITRNLLR